MLDEMETSLKEVVVAQSMYYPGICLMLQPRTEPGT
jgi:hypothetical protein